MGLFVSYREMRLEREGPTPAQPGSGPDQGQAVAGHLPWLLCPEADPWTGARILGGPSVGRAPGASPLPRPSREAVSLLRLADAQEPGQASDPAGTLVSLLVRLGHSCHRRAAEGSWWAISTPRVRAGCVLKRCSTRCHSHCGHSGPQCLPWHGPSKGSSRARCLSRCLSRRAPGTCQGAINGSG